MTSVLVIGNNGLIGSFVEKELKKNSDFENVLGVDLCSTFDLRDKKLIEQYLKKI